MLGEASAMLDAVHYRAHRKNLPTIAHDLSTARAAFRQ